MQDKINATSHITTSGGENNSETQFLAREVQERERSANFWNGWYIKATGLTVIVVALAFIVQSITHRKQRLLGNAQARLIRLKDSQLATDLANKDVEIGIAKRGASEAGDRAAQAAERAGNANERAGNLEKEAALAKRQTEELRQQNLAISGRLTEANEKLEAERKNSRELEKSLFPRVLELVIADKTNFEELKPFAGTTVALEVLTDAESRRAASEITNLLNFAGWKIVNVRHNPEMFNAFFDGVIVQPHTPVPVAERGDRAAWELTQTSMHAATVFEKYLLSRDWQARVQYLDEEIPNNAMIKIIIGFKPNPFFDPAELKEMKKWYKEDRARKRP